MSRKTPTHDLLVAEMPTALAALVDLFLASKERGSAELERGDGGERSDGFAAEWFSPFVAAGFVTRDSRRISNDGGATSGTSASGKRRERGAGKRVLAEPAITELAITEAGIEFVRSLAEILKRTEDHRPAYRAERRELWFRGEMVYRHGKTAPIVSAILREFEETFWLTPVAPPLDEAPPPDTRIHDAINRLNRRTAKFGLHFDGDGTGRGIHWRNCPPRPPPPAAHAPPHAPEDAPPKQKHQ